MKAAEALKPISRKTILDLEKLSSRVAHERLIRKCFIDHDQEMALGRITWSRRRAGTRFSRSAG